MGAGCVLCRSLHAANAQPNLQRRRRAAPSVCCSAVPSVFRPARRPRACASLPSKRNYEEAVLVYKRPRAAAITARAALARATAPPRAPQPARPQNPRKSRRKHAHPHTHTHTRAAKRGPKRRQISTRSRATHAASGKNRPPRAETKPAPGRARALTCQSRGTRPRPCWRAPPRTCRRAGAAAAGGAPPAAASTRAARRPRPSATTCASAARPARRPCRS